MEKKPKIYTEGDDGGLVPDEDFEYERKLAEEEQKRQAELEEKHKRIAEERERKKRDAEKARDRKIAQDKLDLMKMKAGIADEDEKIKEEHTEKRELKGMEKLANIWYHDKVWICLGAFVVIVAAFLIYDTVTQVRPDLSIMLIADDGLSNYTEELQEIFQACGEDLNGDGKVYIQVIGMPLDSSQFDQIHVANNSKFLANMQQGRMIMAITDSNTDADIQATMVDDLPEQFPDNPYIDEKGLSLNFAFLAEETGFENMPNDLHLCLRRPCNTMDDSLEVMQEHYDTNLAYFTRLADMLTQRAVDENDKGLETEPIKKQPTAGISDTDSKSEKDPSEQ